MDEGFRGLPTTGGWTGEMVCMTCQLCIVEVGQHCHTIAGCNLMQKQLKQGEHLNKRCKLWALTAQAAIG